MIRICIHAYADAPALPHTHAHTHTHTHTQVGDNARKAASGSVQLLHQGDFECKNKLAREGTRPRAVSACSVLNHVPYDHREATHGGIDGSDGDGGGGGGGGFLGVQPWAAHKVFDANASAPSVVSVGLLLNPKSESETLNFHVCAPCVVSVSL